MISFEFVPSFFNTFSTSYFEVTMLLCFGLSWPVSIIKTVTTKVVVGKSPFFMILVIIGYVSGILHKIFYSHDWIICLYILNASMVIFDFYLYAKYSLEAEIAV